jgi:hypothetical protein
MQADYSGFTNAAAITGNAIANIGQQIGGAIKQYGDDEKTIKKSAQMAKSIRDAIPELAGMADNALAELSNPDLSQRDRLAIAEGIQDSLKIGVMGIENNRSNAMMKLEADKVRASMQPSTKKNKSTIGLGDGSEMDVLIDDYGNMTDVFGNPIVGQGTQGAGAAVQNGLPPQNNLGSNLPNTLKPFAGDFQALGSKYKVDPNLLAAISMHETGNGTSSAFRNKNNAMGVSNESGPIQMGSVPESIDRMARLLGQGINEETGPYAGVKSIRDIASIYAPPGAGNDPNNLNQNWTSGVTSNLQKLTQNAEANGIANASQPQYGVRSPKPTERFRTATKEEAAQNNATAGQVDEISGRFYRQDPPSGMEIKSDGEGGFTLIQGSGAGQKAQGAMEARKRIGEQGLGVVLENLGSVYDQINKVSDSAIGAAAQSQIAKLLPATEIGAIKDQIETVNNNISFDTVNQLRASSTTGSAGGNITEKEWPRFEGRLGKIYVGQNKDLFTKNVKSIAYTMYDAVNGTPEEVDKLLDENKITQQDYNNYLSERSSLRMKFGSVNSTNPIEEAKIPKATDNPLNLSPEAEAILKGL